MGGGKGGEERPCPSFWRGKKPRVPFRPRGKRGERDGLDLARKEGGGIPGVVAPLRRVPVGKKGKREGGKALSKA